MKIPLGPVGRSQSSMESLAQVGNHTCTITCFPPTYSIQPSGSWSREADGQMDQKEGMFRKVAAQGP